MLNNNSEVAYLTQMIRSEQTLMSSQPDFAILSKFNRIDIDSCKSRLANVFAKIWKLSRLYELDENVVLNFSNYYL
jgi:hypothetical protein